MWSILYEAEGCIYQIGPFNTEDEAMEAAKARGEFDIQDQRVYIIGPNHRMRELSESDLIEE